MVQLYYYENRGKGCKKLLRHDGYPTKVLLYPYEGWAQPALMTYWLLKTQWWSKTTCRIAEISGHRKIISTGKMTDIGKGTMCIKGKFKGSKEPDFVLYLTTNVSNADFHQGYSMTGTLERGNHKKGEQLQMTHFAMIKRKGY